MCFQDGARLLGHPVEGKKSCTCIHTVQSRILLCTLHCSVISVHRRPFCYELYQLNDIVYKTHIVGKVCLEKNACFSVCQGNPIQCHEPFPKQALVIKCLQYKSSANTERKREIARNEQFLLFSQCFLLVWRTFCHFHQI